MSMGWLQKEILKDKNRVKSHKGSVISEIKFGGMKSIFHKPRVKKIEKVGIWKKLRNLIGF